MLSLSAYASVLCTIAAFSNAQHPHYHQWNHYGPPGAVSLSSSASTAPSATATVAVTELESSGDSSPVAGSSASSSVSGTAPSSAVSGTSSTSDDTSSSSITPGNKKAGVAGFKNIQITHKAALAQYAPYISWYSDYWPNTPDFPSGTVTVKGIPMLWGNGDLNTTDATAPISTAAADDQNRYNAYEALPASPAPSYMMGFYEPDWPAPYSSNMNPPTGATAWKNTLGKLPDSTLIGSPSMARQLDDDWLEPFMTALGVTEVPWDYTCIHANKNSSQGVKDDVGYYYNKFKKPVWVAEFACVNDQSADWGTCEQDVINTFIPEVVEFFEGNSTVVAYGYSNGAGLGSVWPLIDSSTGDLTPSGNCYLDVLQGKIATGQSCT